MIPHTGWLRCHLESALILLAAWILGGRNVTRSGVVSRRNNNEMFEMDGEPSPVVSATSTANNPSPNYSSPPTYLDGGHGLTVFR